MLLQHDGPGRIGDPYADLEGLAVGRTADRARSGFIGEELKAAAAC
jgi:hypothetical protein